MQNNNQKTNIRGGLLTTILPNFVTYADSLILSTAESLQLYQFTKQSKNVLLYRGSRDGFNAPAFHSKCDNRNNTVTIIQTSGNYVFGGYTAMPWKSDYSYSYDPKAFIFSLRQASVYIIGAKFSVVDATTAIWNNPLTGPVFGSYIGYNFCDILVGYSGPYFNMADLGSSYSLPLGFSAHSTTAQNYLAGSESGWIVTEIEVYQITK